MDLQNNDILQRGYNKFLSGNLDEALANFVILKGSSPFVNWMINFIRILKDEQDVYPTYFQIRNFYEQDLEQLFQEKQIKLIEKIISKNTYLENFNREIYKYTGRVLFNNGYINVAEKMILKSIDICYNDPESHYILGEIHIQNGDKNRAKEEFKKAINVSSGYLPASNRLKDLLN